MLLTLRLLPALLLVVIFSARLLTGLVLGALVDCIPCGVADPPPGIHSLGSRIPGAPPPGIRFPASASPCEASVGGALCDSSCSASFDGASLRGCTRPCTTVVGGVALFVSVPLLAFVF